jgi:8-oxo-dGTP pyrophosphatase MutT (NUDIX family)
MREAGGRADDRGDGPGRPVRAELAESTGSVASKTFGLADDGTTAIRPGVAAVLRDDRGQVLLHRRRVGGGWAPPSGSVEPGETVLMALHRELKEETGLTAVVERAIGVYSDPAYMIVAYPDGRVVHFVTTLFLCRVAAGTLAGNDEGLAWGWFSADALPNDLTSYARVWLSDALGGAESTVIR